MAKNKFQQGQGLMEIIVAVAVITTGVVGALALTSSSLRGNEVSQNQIVAANLAREGQEVVRSIRDENWLQGNNWLTGLQSLVPGDYDGILNFNDETHQWEIDFIKNGIASGRIYRDSNGFYNHTSGEITFYWRIVSVKITHCQHRVSEVVNQRNGSCQPNEDPVGIKVKTWVQWLERGQTKDYILEENLYNWHDET